MQNYNLEMVHRSSDKMLHVDALSRYILAIEASSLEDELIQRQMRDESIRKLTESIRKLTESLEYKEDKRFVLQNACLKTGCYLSCQKL